MNQYKPLIYNELQTRHIIIPIMPYHAQKIISSHSPQLTVIVHESSIVIPLNIIKFKIVQFPAPRKFPSKTEARPQAAWLMLSSAMVSLSVNSASGPIVAFNGRMFRGISWSDAKGRGRSGPGALVKRVVFEQNNWLVVGPPL